MRLQRENESLVFSLSPAERWLLARVLRELIEKYRLKPDELDAATMAVWYSSRGCATAGMSAEETKEWLEHLHAFKKGASLQRLEEWSAQLDAGSVNGNDQSTSLCPIPLTDPHSLRLSTEHAPAFVTALNDYRLAAAARHDIGQAEMDAHSPWQLARLPPSRQQAVLEIHFLAWMIEETLRVTQS
jgi:hypothetical protein